MQAISQNPFRVVGLLASDDKRTVEKQKAKISAFQKVGKPVSSEYDLEQLGAVNRDNGQVDSALAKINLNQNRVDHGLFWFISANHVDEAALENLRSGSVLKAEEMWLKIVQSKEISDKTYSAYTNLGTLKIATSLKNGSVNSIQFVEGVQLKSDMILSDSFRSFVHNVADETFSVDSQKELKAFLKTVSSEVNELVKAGVALAEKILPSLAAKGGMIGELLSSELTEAPRARIETAIEKTSKVRKQTPNEAYAEGKRLFVSTRADLEVLEKYWGISDIRFRTISDQLANEILQCGIDYFVEFRDNETVSDRSERFAKNALEVIRFAEGIAVGDQVRERIDDNREGIEGWIEDAPKREQESKVLEQVKFITAQLKLFDTLTDSVASAERLVDQCHPKLLSMRTVLGADDEFYLQVSSAVVSQAQGMLVSVVNQAQEDWSSHFISQTDLRATVLSAYDVSKKLAELDMFQNLRTSYRSNHNTLRSIADKLRPYNAPSTASRTYTSSSTSTSSSEDYSWIWWVIGIGIFLIAVSNC